MDKKMPVVGKRYLSDFFRKRTFLINDINERIVSGYWEGELELTRFLADYFSEHFEELPTQESEVNKTDESVAIEEGKVNERVKEAMEELERFINCDSRADAAIAEHRGEASYLQFVSDRFSTLAYKCKNLLNALDEQKLATSCDKSKNVSSEYNNGAVSRDVSDINVATKSIWKPVSEFTSLPYSFQGFLRSPNSDSIIAGTLIGNFLWIGSTPDSKIVVFSDQEFCQLSDFINQCESERQARIELEEKVNRLWNWARKQIGAEFF